MKALRILVADDHAVVRQGVKALLCSRQDWEICGEAVSGRDAVEKATALRPDLVVLDISMPELNGVDAARQIREAVPECQVLIFSMHKSAPLARDAMAAGAAGYVLKSGDSQEVVRAIEAMGAHQTYVSPEILAVLSEADQLRGPVRSDADRGLTDREREILQLVASGLTSKEVAASLGLSVATVDTHRARIMRKLQCRSVVDMAHYAIQSGLVQA